MGTNKFQEEYIEYLEDYNANLRSKLAMIKEFEARLLDKESRNRNYEIAIEEISTICKSTCQAIDNLFEKLTATMNSLKCVLLWKSQISQIPDKIFAALKGVDDKCDMIQSPEKSSNETSSFGEISNWKNGKKCGRAKVSPMIKGHVISTPRVCLNRVNDGQRHSSISSVPMTLSPIIEVSPNGSPNRDGGIFLKEVGVQLHRLDFENASKKPVLSEGSSAGSGSPRFRLFRRESPGYELRKQYNSLHVHDRINLVRHKLNEGVPLITEQNAGGDDDVRNDEDDVIARNEQEERTAEVNENGNGHTNKFGAEMGMGGRNNLVEEPPKESSITTENVIPGKCQQSSNVNARITEEQLLKEAARPRSWDRDKASNLEEDPLEGPSWLLDRHSKPGKRSPGSSSYEYSFVNFKRPNFLYPHGKSFNDKDGRNSLNHEENAQNCSFGANHKAEENELQNMTTVPGLKDTTSQGKRTPDRPENTDLRKSWAGTPAVDRSHSRNSSERQNREGTVCVTPALGTVCYVELNEIDNVSTPGGRGSASLKSKPRKSSTSMAAEEVDKSHAETSGQRTRRRAAELCNLRRNWIEITPKRITGKRDPGKTTSLKKKRHRQEKKKKSLRKS